MLSPRPSSSQSDVKVVSSEASSAVGSIWKKNSPRNPQIHKSPSKSEDMPNTIIESEHEGRVVNIDEAIACRNSARRECSVDDVTVRHSNGRLDRHGDNNRNHRLLGEAVLLDHQLGVAVNNSSSSLRTTSSDEHVFKNYFDNSWDQLRHSKLSQHEQPVNTGGVNSNEIREQTVISPYTTHLESDL